MRHIITPKEKRTEILARLAAGESLRGVCASAGMPSAGTVCGWVRKSEGFARQYRAARRKGGAQ